MKVCLVSNSQDNKGGKRQEIQHQGQFPPLLDYSKHLMVIKSFSCIIHFIWKLQPFKWGILCLHNFIEQEGLKKCFFFLFLKTNKQKCLPGSLPLRPQKERFGGGGCPEWLAQFLADAIYPQTLVILDLRLSWITSKSFLMAWQLYDVDSCLFSEDTGESLMYFLSFGWWFARTCVCQWGEAGGATRLWYRTDRVDCGVTLQVVLKQINFSAEGLSTPDFPKAWNLWSTQDLKIGR